MITTGKNTDRTTLLGLAHQAMIEHGFEPQFPPPVEQELAALKDTPPGLAGRRDLRELPWASIDNDDSLDLDQLTVAESLPDGTVRILVAVADVDSLVPRDSALDRHAALNTTSVYTPAAIFAMLPKALSTGLTSLNPHQDRAAVVVAMVFTMDGTLVSSEISNAVVRNHAKLAYASVGAWLAGTGPMPTAIAAVPGLEANLQLQARLAQRLMEQRHRRGALTLETIEPRVVFVGDVLSHLEATPKNQATQLIEDFMIAANGVVASFLAGKKFPSLRRVVRSPERWLRLVQLAAKLGESLPAEVDGAALEAFLTKRREADPEKFPDLSLAVVKLIGRGEYVLDPPGGTAPGHFGLAVENYSHSTAPNRRFPDLITQRLLKAALTESPPTYTLKELGELATHCTEREGAATKVERSLRKSAAALLLAGRIGEHFEGIVTGMSPKGTWVRLLRPPAEGRLKHGYEGLMVGDRVSVELVQTDVARGFIDFARGAADGPRAKPTTAGPGGIRG